MLRVDKEHFNHKPAFKSPSLGDQIRHLLIRYLVLRLSNSVILSTKSESFNGY